MIRRILADHPVSTSAATFTSSVGSMLRQRYATSSARHASIGSHSFSSCKVHVARTQSNQAMQLTAVSFAINVWDGFDVSTAGDALSHRRSC
jgi:hypothetical protein